MFVVSHAASSLGACISRVNAAGERQRAIIERCSNSRFVRSPSSAMRFIDRAANGVIWNDATATLFPMEDTSSDHVAWFGRILDAAREEYGIALEINDQTVWSDVPADVAAALAALQQG